MELDRRTFLKGAAFSGAAAAVAGLAGCAPQDAQTAAAEQEVTGKHTWEIVPEPIAESDIAEIIDVDVLIIGCGVGGLAAAEAASAAGASVVVVEQADRATNHGSDNGAIGTRVQEELGLTVEPDAICRMIYEWNQQATDFNLLQTWADRSGEVFNHYFDLADEIGLQYGFALCPTSKTDWTDLDYPFRVYPTGHSFGDLTWDESNGGLLAQQTFIDMLQDKATEQGTDFRFNTHAEQLLRDGDGPVTGAVCSNDNGYLRINASKGVILATGSIDGNEEMVDCWCPMAKRVDVNNYTPIGGNLGEGVLMGMWVGAAHQKTAAALIAHPYYPDCPPLGSFFGSWLMVNEYGQRLGNEVPVEPNITNMMMNAPHRVAYSVWDSDWAKWIMQQQPAAGQTIIDDEGPKFEDALAKGSLVEADTLEELAQKLEMDESTFLATVESFNANYAAGEDAEFGVPPRFLSTLEKAPFYAAKVPAGNGVVIFGLNVDRNSQVCDADDNPIEGLFAVGNVQGNFFNYTYPVVAPGISHGRALTFGNLVGHALAQDRLLNEEK